MSNIPIVVGAISFVHQLLGNIKNTDPYLLCKILGISIIDNHKLDKDGYLICQNGLKLIFVSSSINNLHRKKFIIAHELGHFLMHRENMYCCSDIGFSGQEKVNTPLQEKQANVFASELLLPTEEIQTVLPNEHLSFDIISRIANQYQVSMTMTAMKAVQNSKTEDEILLCYENKKIKWFVSSNPEVNFEQIPHICPVPLEKSKTKVFVWDEWDRLYNGSVSQEIFNPYGNQFLILLAGTEWKLSSDSLYY